LLTPEEQCGCNEAQSAEEEHRRDIEARPGEATAGRLTRRRCLATAGCCQLSARARSGLREGLTPTLAADAATASGIATASGTGVATATGANFTTATGAYLAATLGTEAAAALGLAAALPADLTAASGLNAGLASGADLARRADFTGRSYLAGGAGVPGRPRGPSRSALILTALILVLPPQGDCRRHGENSGDEERENRKSSDRKPSQPKLPHIDHPLLR